MSLSQSDKNSLTDGTVTPLTETSDSDISPDVAVVGMACRAAGGATSAQKLWSSVLSKTDASGTIPPFRWESYYGRDSRNPKVLETTTNRGYFVEDIENFDAAFFGISPKEAEQMDPQQRIALEVAWEALEDAGIAPQSLSGSDTAVFMGVNSDDYSKLLLEDLPRVEAWMGIGTAYCGIPNRISYHLNLMGPSTAVDAACASSLVAIHHGRQAILQGESRLAIVGGVNALCGPGLTSVLQKAGATSPDGRCLSFDDEAHGYGRGEGAAVVILKNMADAVAEGDHIIAVLKGSAVAQDGRTNGIMAPNAKAQELVARKALRVAAIDPLTIRYVEAHATSTPLGDPTEVSAISAVYGECRPADEPCYIGSVKPNVGHLEAGAGAMGFIKAAMAVQSGTLPPQANLNKLNSRINWAESGLKVVRDTLEWPDSPNHPRRAAICSYGYGGTVSHAVIEQYVTPPSLASVFINEQETTSEGPSAVDKPQILLLSAPQEKRLAIQARTLEDWISSPTGKIHSLASIATTLSSRREHHDYRTALIAANHKEAAELLSSYAQNQNDEIDWVTSRRVLGSDVNREVVWVFSGHGAQWPAMAKDLIANEPTFFKSVSSLEAIVQAECGFSALNAMKTGEFTSSAEIQILTYLMQVGLTAMLRAKGLRPGAVIGHSVGEIAASVAAGCLTPEEGCQIVSKRANLYRQVAGLGAMILVSKPFAEMEQELSSRTDLAAAIDSSPSSCVVSGEKESIEAFANDLKAREIKYFWVKTDVAFHHPMLEALVDPLISGLKASQLSPRPPRVPLYSTSMEDPRSPVLRDIDYWTNNMVKPVRLTSAIVAAAEQDGFCLFLEVASHPILGHSINETVLDRGIEDFAVISTMTRNKPAHLTILNSIAQLHCCGAAVKWKKNMDVDGSYAWASDVPTTTWSHKPVWRKIETGPINTAIMHDVDKHTLLGHRVPIAGEDTIVYTTKVDDKTKPFPGSHPLHGSEIVPAAALVNTFLHATGANVISNIVLRVPVAISQQREVQVIVGKDQVRICSRLSQSNDSSSVSTNDDNNTTSWLTHTTGSWVPNISDAYLVSQNVVDIQSIKSRISTRLADNFSIDYLDKVGVSAMGFPWAVTEHYGNLDEMIARVDVAPGVNDNSSLPWDAHSWAPILDSATSVGSTIFFDQPRLRMPAQIEAVEVYTKDSPPKTGWLYVERVKSSTFAVHVSVLSEDGRVLARFTSMRFSEIEGTMGVSGSAESLTHQLAWPPASYSEDPLPIAHLVLVSEDQELAAAYEQSVLGRVESIITLTGSDQLSDEIVGQKDTSIVYVPGRSDMDSIPTAAHSFTQELLAIIKLVASASSSARVFALTDGVSSSQDATALAQSPLHGLARIIASEQPEQWGALIDIERQPASTTAPVSLPLNTMKYVRDVDVIRMLDGIPRVARLRPLPRQKLLSNTTATSGIGTKKEMTLLPKPSGTYIVTGGLGALGLEVAEFLVESGARRLVLVSRRSLPPRSEWTSIIAESTTPVGQVLEKIQSLETRGASIHTVAVDMSSPAAASELSTAITTLSLPPVLGVVHAAGVLEDQLILSTTAPSFSRVLAPKISGTLALHDLFPPGTLDFMVLFSSCGQLFGFPGQASYASGNAFLDSLATHRRRSTEGDNTIAVQWTSWRGLGMAASTDFIDAELATKGITDVTRNEAFQAWTHFAKYDTDHAVVLRALTLEADEPLPCAVLADISVRRTADVSSSSGSGSGSAGSSSSRATQQDTIPADGSERQSYLDLRIRECVAVVLHMGDAEDVDSKAPLSNLGVDSVMTVTLRARLQKVLGVKVPPTLTWSYPTVGHLVGWFMDKVGK